jgi:hypothetical protein
MRRVAAAIVALALASCRSLKSGLPRRGVQEPPEDQGSHGIGVRGGVTRRAPGD